MACQEYTSSLDPRARLPTIVLERAELARRHAIGTPWIELVRGYALWLNRQTAGLSAILDAVVEALPEFPVVGEVILRRWLDDRHVDAIAALLRPVGIDWFHAPRIGGVRIEP